MSLKIILSVYSFVTSIHFFLSERLCRQPRKSIAFLVVHFGYLTTILNIFSLQGDINLPGLFEFAKNMLRMPPNYLHSIFEILTFEISSLINLIFSLLQT